MIRRMAILGAGGDLANRYLFPALAGLLQSGRLPDGLRALAVDRPAQTSEGFRSQLAERLARHAGKVASRFREELVARVDFRRADLADPAGLAALLGRAEEPWAVYLALPPRLFQGVVRGLGAAQLPAGSRVVIEKPFGEDLASARALNRLVEKELSEEAVFRMDHFLGEQTVQNLLCARFANRLFEPIWSREHIEKVEIVWDEALTLEGRAGYYDSAGALRDMIQSHLLQVLCLVAMDPPGSLDARDLRDRKAAVLRAVRAPRAEQMARLARRGRYGEGRIGERAVPAYVDEPGVDPARGTETFARVVLDLDTWRWAGVPFELRTGKALARDRREVAIHFRPVPGGPFRPQSALSQNVMRLSFDPDRLGLELNFSGPAPRLELARHELTMDLEPPELPAYGRLLLTVLEGNLALSIRGDEAEESWRIVEPIVEAFRSGAAPLLEYPAGSQGP